jgi:RNA polymerase sigma-70 factor (ECF subfamily)
VTEGAGDQDRELVARLAEGDAAAWSEFVSRDGPLVVALVRRALHNRGIRAGESDVDDIVGEVFAAFLERDRHLVKSFRFGCSWRSWLAIVAQGRIGRWLRSRGKTSGAPLDEQLVAEDSSEGPLAQADRADQATKLREAIARLPERDRIALRLFYEEKLSREEIGRVLATNAEHVGVILDRARRKLRDMVS